MALRPTNRRFGLAVPSRKRILPPPPREEINVRRKRIQSGPLTPPRKELSFRRKPILPPPPRENFDDYRKRPRIKFGDPRHIQIRKAVEVAKARAAEIAKRTALEQQKIKLAVTPELTKITSPVAAVKQTIADNPEAIDIVNVPDGSEQAGMPLAVKIVIGSLAAGTILMFALRPQNQAKDKGLSGTKKSKPRKKTSKKSTHKVRAVALT